MLIFGDVLDGAQEAAPAGLIAERLDVLPQEALRSVREDNPIVDLRAYSLRGCIFNSLSNRYLVVWMDEGKQSLHRSSGRFRRHTKDPASVF